MNFNHMRMHCENKIEGSLVMSYGQSGLVLMVAFKQKSRRPVTTL